MTVTTLMPDAGAPLLLHIGANALLFAHIAGGSVAIAAGYVAVTAKKGRRLHQLAGTTFFIAMLVMTGVAAATAPFLDAKWTNTTAAVFTFYLTVTGWMAIRRRPAEVGRFERVAVLVPLGIIAMAAVLGVVHAGSPRLSGFSTVFAFAAISALAAACDLGMIRQGGLAGPARLARHLWRMGAAFFVATGSFFIGQQRQFPEAWQGSPIWLIPAFAPLGFLAFWMVRVRLLPALRQRARTRPAAA